jgi:hypothetical protein
MPSNTGETMPERVKVINPKSSYFNQHLKVLEREPGYYFLECPTTHRKMRFANREIAA